MSFFPTHNDAIHNCVETGTVSALHSKKMPRSSMVILLAIIASNIDNTTQLGWHWLQGDACCHGIPGRHHAFLRLGRLFTYRTTRVMCRKLTEAVPMNRVTARHFVTGRTRGKEIFLTDGTVGLVLAHLAVVIVVEGAINAHAAIVTVLKILGTADAAKATVFAMVRTFLIGHPQVANVAVVVTKLDVARYAVVSVMGEK
jgi:hypothetical protein